MAREFLSYWKPDGLSFLQHTQWKACYLGSDQLAKRGIDPGDRIWITTMRSEYLNLIAPLVVGEIVEPQRAREIIGVAEVYKAKFYAIAKDPQTVRQFSIDEFVDQLRFVGATDRLRRTNGRVDAQQLQTIRELTADSANLLQAAWDRKLAGAKTQS